MDVTVTQLQGRVPVTAFHVKGDIDSATYQQLQTQIEQSIQGGTHDMILDLTEVGYMSSAGIRLLSHLFNLLRGDSLQESDAAMKQGVRDGTFQSPHLKLVKPTPRVTEVLKLSGIDMMIGSYPSMSEAIASF